MILETAPDKIITATGPHLEMVSQVYEDAAWEQTMVRCSKAATVLGVARQKRNAKHLVRFFEGKGGFCAVVGSHDLVYFGLPGSHISLPDTEVELPGEWIPGKPEGLVCPRTASPVQTVTQQAMILGAGLATRFEPISGETTGCPKPGVPLVGEDSVITTIVKLLAKHGFRKILVNTCYKPECLKAHLAHLPGMEIEFVDELTPSGTAGGLAKALELGLVDRSKPILVIQGDAITDADMSLLIHSHQQQAAAVTIGGQIVQDEDVDKFGIIETDGAAHDGQSGNITSFKEKPSLAEAGNSRFANAGFYVLAPEIYDLFLQRAQQPHKKAGLYDYAHDFFPTVLAQILEKNIIHHETGQPMTFWAQALGGYWSDMGNPTQYIEALRDIYHGRVVLDLPMNLTDYYENGIIYWPGAKLRAIAEEAVLKGNIIVGLPDEVASS